MKVKVKLLFLLLFFSGLLFSQNDSCRVKPNWKYLKSYFTNTKNSLIAPVKWDKREWIAFGGIAAGTTLIMSQDLKIQNFFQKNRTPFTDSLSKYGFEPFGSGVYSLPIMATFFLHGAIFKNQRSMRVGLLGVESYLIAGAFVNIPKHLFGRHRPYQVDTKDPYYFEGPTLSTKYVSFCSGHTTAAFAVATIVATEYKEKPVIPVVCYTIASMTGLSRINDNKHWASDVFAGAALGFAIGKLIYHGSCTKKLNISAYQSGKNTGVVMSYRF